MFLEHVQIRGVPIRAIMSCVGAFLICLMLGAFYTFGNIMPYLVSYMRSDLGVSQNITYSDFASVNLVFGIGNGVSLFIAPMILVPLLGNRLVLIIGCVLFCGGALATRWTMEHSLNLVILTYGLIQGLGNMALMPCYTVPMSWFPEHKGKIMGIVIAGYGISSTIMNQVQLAITNPNDVEAISPDGTDDAYFEDPDVLERVPTLLYSLAGIYAIFQLIGILLTSDPPDFEAPKVSFRWSSLKEALKGFGSSVLTRREFYLLFITRFCFTIVTQTIPTYYKAFGLTFIQSDSFITNYIGTFSGIMQWISRMAYGFALDWLPYKIVVCFQSGILAVFVGTFYLTCEMGKIAYLIWMYIIYLTFPAIYAILPAKCTEVFGTKYGGPVIGTIALGDIILNLTIKYVGEAILQGDRKDYLYFFLFVTIGPVLGCVATLFFRQTDEDKTRSTKIRQVLCKTAIKTHAP